MRSLALLLFASLSLCAAPKAPAWLEALRAQPVPKYGAKVGAVVLLNERRAVVDGRGKTNYFVRYAVRVITNDGRSSATARLVYRTESGKVKEMNAWLITPAGTVKEYGKKEVVDIALAENDVYNESRARAIAAGGEAIPGSVFAFEGEMEDKSVFTQHDWTFQSRLPALLSRFTIELPAGWRAESRTYNHQPIEARISGSTYSWELARLPPLEPEESGPGIDGLAPRVAISYFPPAGTAPDAVAFSSWKEVASWLSTLNDAQTVADEALKAKVRELTASAPSERAKLEALGRFAQDVKYVSIQMGISRGGGYRPHAANDVFGKLYGDCKDKSNLLRTMLREAGIESYPVAIFSGDPTYVQEDWPSPQQFNHAILAIRVSPEFDAPAVQEYPQLGRLLFFDPTDEFTPMGFLPDHEQGSYALVVHPEFGSLVKAPKVSAEANHLERSIKASLREDGSLVAVVTERCSGESATDNRRLHKSVNEAGYRRIIERWVARGVPGSSVEKIETADESGEFHLDVELSAGTYGQIMNGRLWMFKPALIERRGWYGLGEEKRTQPFLLDPDSYAETVEILLPKGFRVDEVPENLELESDFGKFSATWEHTDGLLIFKQSFRSEGGTIPPEEYASMRKFLRAVSGATQSAVVLEKQ